MAFDWKPIVSIKIINDKLYVSSGYSENISYEFQPGCHIKIFKINETSTGITELEELNTIHSKCIIE